MRTIAFLTQKGGAGKTTLAASLAVAAAAAGERVIALDLDPQASMTNWAKRRAAAQVAHNVLVEPLDADRLPRLGAIIDGLAGAGFTLAIFDTPGTQGAAVRYVAEAVDFCLLPARPTCLDVEATAATFRAAYMAKRKAAFVLNQCPPTYRSARASAAAKDLTSLGVLAETMLTARIDFQDAIAAGLGVTEYEPEGRAAQEIIDLWNWVKTRLAAVQHETTAEKQPTVAKTALSDRLAGIARSAAHLSAYATPTRD